MHICMAHTCIRCSPKSRVLPEATRNYQEWMEINSSANLVAGSKCPGQSVPLGKLHLDFPAANETRASRSYLVFFIPFRIAVAFLPRRREKVSRPSSPKKISDKITSYFHGVRLMHNILAKIKSINNIKLN